MATRNVPGTYPTISAAVAAAVAGDTILVAAGYAGNEAVSVTVNNLTFNAPASVPGVVLTAAAGILKITLAGASPIQIIGNSGNNSFTGNTGANIITDGGGGDDTLKGGGGNDTITVTGGADTVDGGVGTDDLLIVDYSTATASVSTSSGMVSDGGTRTVHYKNVERLQITGGSGDDTLVTLSGSDSLSGGAGDDVFKLSLAYSSDTGTIDGGAGTDTVVAKGQEAASYDNLGNYEFRNVEILDANGGKFSGTIAQLSSFGTLTDSTMPANATFSVGLSGEGGTIDFSTRVTGQHAVQVDGYGASSGYTVIGTANRDLLYGSQYNDTLIGGDGNDILDGGEGADTVDGGNGNDVLTDYYSSGNVLIGGDGDDFFYHLYGSDSTIDGGAGIDTVETADLGGYSFSNVEVLIVGTDYVNGTAAQFSSFRTLTFSGGPDYSRLQVDLKGPGGTLDLSTRITGQHSAHVVDAGVTAGYAVTGTVNGDWLQGSAYNDSLDGGAGNDILSGGDGIDLLHGGAGNDSLSGKNDGDAATYYDAAGGVKVNLATTTAQNTQSAGNDTLSGIPNLIGSAFDDQLTGDANANRLDGGAGNDTLTGGAGLDTLVGGKGNDVLNGNSDGDTASYDTATAGVTVNLGTTSAQNTVGAGTDTLSGISNLIGSRFSDQLTGDGSANLLGGGDGNDTLSGGAGIDLLYGAAGNDKLDGGTGADTMVGGAGNDTYTVDNAGDLVREDSTAGIDDGGTDLVNASASVTLGAFVENLTLTGSTAIDGTGNDLANKINGNDAVNHLTGGAGADVLTGNGGADLLDGGDDGDTYYVDASDIIHDTGTTGTDKVQSNGSYILAAGSGVEQLTTKAGVVGGNLTGDEAANIITGNTGTNILNGKAGNDTLTAGDGTDTLIGGLGKDRMTGGADADIFRFAPGDSQATTVGYDTVTDFETGIDRMDLSIFAGSAAASAYAEIAVASNAFATLKSAAEAQMTGGVKAVFVAGSSNGWLFWNTDATPNTAEQAVTLTGRTSLTDFAVSDLM